MVQKKIPGTKQTEAMLKLVLTLSSLSLHCHLRPLQAANCCRNSRLVVDGDDLKWVKN